MTQGLSSLEIYRVLHTEIMTLVIAPGSCLRENALCQRFGVSRTPIRSVLQELRINGLVDVTPYKSTLVTRLDFDSICQQIYLRIAVESAVLTDYCAAATPEHLRALRARNEAMRRAADAPDFEPARFYQMDSDLHRCWFSALQKEHIWQIIQNSQNDYSRFRMLDLVAAHNYGKITQEHDQLLDAIAAGDCAEVRRLITAHLHGGVARLGQELTTRYSDYFAAGTMPTP